ncbi:MAG: T9SS type A sorting domain-containing protein [Salibacteraceae bacterium]
MNLFSFSSRTILLILFFRLAFNVNAQVESRNGWAITPVGELRVLIIYAEINYPTATKNDDKYEWDQGDLPTWANQRFDHQWTGSPSGDMTKFFYEMSLGNYIVLGDYIDQPITVDSADVINIGNHASVASAVISEANTLGSLNTQQGYGFNDFDFWDDAPAFGAPRNNTGNDSYDHVMIFLRNWAEQSASAVIPGNIPVNLYSKPSDTYSVFQSNSFDIRKHEYGHLLLGNNNFHSSGGHDNTSIPSYFIPNQGGWGIMGNAASSIKTINAWERRRLDWKAAGRSMNISCLDGGTEISTDLDALNPSHQNAYKLRDFVTTGDAIRIKLPFLPEDEFQQWLWIENHQGLTEFDNHENVGCQTPFQKGLYMYIQVDRDSLEGGETFDGFADFIKPLPASGMFDVELLGDTFEYCFGSANNEHRIHDYTHNNPLAGYSDLQNTDYDKNNDGHIMGPERTANFSDIESGSWQDQWAWRGHTRHAFHNGFGGNNKIGIATNPSTASHTTLVSDNFALTLGTGDPQNNRSIYLNGVSVEITNYHAGSGEITVEVRFDDIELNENTRWCGDDIVLSNMPATYPSLVSAGWSLELGANKVLNIDRNLMPSRISDPDTADAWGTSQVLFNDPTTFRMEPKAKMKAYEGSTINVKHGSTFILGDQNELDLEDATLNIIDGSTLILNPGSLLDLSGVAGTVVIDTSSTLIIRGNSAIHLNGDDSDLQIWGTVIVEDGGEFTFTGDGLISFGGTIITDTSASWTLRGDGKEDVVMDLYSTADWEDGGSVSFTSGRIQFMGNDVSINIENCSNVNINEMYFTSEVYFYVWENNKALNLINADLDLQNTDFIGFEYGVKTAQYADTNTIYNSVFDRCIHAIDASNVSAIKVLECDIQSVGNLPGGGPIYYYNTGVSAHKVSNVQMDLTDINYAGYGVLLDSVEGFYMRGGLIDSSNTGIRSIESLVFLRNGATVQNSLEFGVHMMATDPLNSMITMGDSGCANIIKNDIGIHGMGTTVNIDAYLHAENSGTPTFVQFNRLDQNPYNYVEMCYHDTIGLFIPDTVHMKGVYFGGSAPSSTEFETYKTEGFYPNEWSCGTTITDITDDFTQHSTCTPMGICDCYSGTVPPGNGSFGGVYNKMNDAGFDTLTYDVSFDRFESEPSNLNKLVLTAFQKANNTFLMEDTEQTRSEFVPLASVGLVRLDNNWLALSNRDQLYELDEESIHRIVVAKVLTEYPLGPTLNSPDIFKEYNDWKLSENDNPSFKVYPNPTRDQVNIDVSGHGEVYEYNLVSNLGMTLKRGKITSGTNIIKLNEIGAGVYYLRINSNENILTKRIVKSAN